MTDEFGAVAGDHLVGALLLPRAVVPGPPKLVARLLVGVVGPPLRLVAIDIRADLVGTGGERADVRRELLDLARLGVERVPAVGESVLPLRVTHHHRVTDAVDRSKAVAEPDGMQTAPPLPHLDPGIDLQVEVPMRIARPRRVVTHDHCLDLVDRHLNLQAAGTDACRGVLGDPSDELFRCTLLGRVVGRGDLRMQSGRE